MKQIFAVLTALMLLCALTACGEPENLSAPDSSQTIQEENPSEKESSSTTDVSTPVADEEPHVLVTYFSATGNTENIFLSPLRIQATGGTEIQRISGFSKKKRMTWQVKSSLSALNIVIIKSDCFIGQSSAGVTLFLSFSISVTFCDKTGFLSQIFGKEFLTKSHFPYTAKSLFARHYIPVGMQVQQYRLNRRRPTGRLPVFPATQCCLD